MNKTTIIALLSVITLCTLALMPAAAATGGNTLITDMYGRVFEVDADGNIVWEVNQTTMPDNFCPQEADRLANGNTLIVESGSPTVRVIEVDAGGNIVWEINETIVEGTGPWWTWGWIMDVDRIPPAVPADLTPTTITPNCGYLFDGNNNEICVLIENNGGYSSAFSVSIDINGDTQIVTVPELAAGENTSVCVTDSTIRNAGDTVTITVTADCNDEVTEDNETNNALSSSETVVYNGYKGKRHTGGEDITTKNTFDLHGDLVYSAGDSYYLSSYSYPNWTTYDASWTDAELVIPATATVVDARLYVPYTWDKASVMSGVSLTFNAAAQTPYAHYADEKMYGTSYPYGTLVYDVTGDFDTTGNTANLINTHNGGGNVSMRGMMLVVVYEDATEPRRQIFVNEEFDLLYGGSNYGTTPEEATAWAPITGAAINPALTANARLITFAPGADGTGTAGEGELIFNGEIWNDEWTDNEVHQIGISDRDVTAFLQSTGNEVGIRSNADWMEAMRSW